MSFALTVIIPSYNNASFLERCIGSISAPESSVEIIVVDDGSTDDTVRVLAGLKDRLSNLKVISQANGGVSCARNAGLREASGRFVTFLDADDQLYPEALSQIVLAINTFDSDVIIFRSLCGDVEQYPWMSHFHEREIYSSKDLMKTRYIRGSACGCFFKLDFLRKNRVLFCQDLSIAEDTVFFACAIAEGASISFINANLYIVIPREGSASRVVDSSLLPKYGKALHAARELIPDRCVADNTILTILLGIVNVAVNTDCPPKYTYEKCSIGNILPLSVNCFYKHKWLVRILNHSFRSFYEIKKIKDGRLKTV